MEQQKINVEEIMDELRKEIAAKDLQDIEDFEDVVGMDIYDEDHSEPFDLNMLLSEAELMNKSFWFDCNIPVCGKFKFIKKIVRKFGNFIVQHYVTQHNEYNEHVVRCINQLRNFIYSDAETRKKLDSVCNIVNGEIGLQIKAQSKRTASVLQDNYILKKDNERLLSELEEGKEKQKVYEQKLELLELKLETLSQKVQLSDN